MITLLTGAPGAGKTAYLLKMILKYIEQGRPLFVHGIPELSVKHEKIYCRSPSCEHCALELEKLIEGQQNRQTEILYAEEWHEWAPNDSLLVLDEVQHIYRPRSPGREPPPSVKAFETHRHKGLDFYLVSQAPKLFDNNVRQLVSRHIHLTANFARRVQYEWPECQTNIESKGSAIKSNYTLDPKVFPLYKSASLHTKVDRKAPPALKLVIGVIPVIALLGYFLVNRIVDRTQLPDEVDALAATSPGAAPISSPGQLANNQHRDTLDFTPSRAYQLESAPAYRDLVTVADFPKLKACIMIRDECTCYTQQATVYPTSYMQCFNFTQGRSFDPYTEPTRQSMARTPMQYGPGSRGSENSDTVPELEPMSGPSLPSPSIVR